MGYQGYLYVVTADLRHNVPKFLVIDKSAEEVCAYVQYVS